MSTESRTFRNRWRRSDPTAGLDATELEPWVRRAFPQARICDVIPAEGGFSNTNLRVQIRNPDRQLRVRVFHRGAEVAHLELAVAQRLCDHVPIPYCHDFDESGPDGRPVAIYDWVEGERLEQAQIDAHQGMAVARDCGRILAAIHAVRFPQTGLLDANLRVREPFAAGAAGLVDFASSRFANSDARDRIGQPLADAFEGWLPGAAGALDAISDATLCHGDFGASNLIVRRGEAGDWGIVAVLDWEYACSGTVFGDLGNLLRPPLGEREGFSEDVAAGFRDAGGSLPENWLTLTRLSDLFAWIEFASRALIDESVLETVRERISATMRELS